MIIEPGLGGAVVGAEAQHDPDLVGLDPVEAAGQPDHQDRDQDDGDPGAGAEPAGQDAAEAVLAAPQQFLEIGGIGAAAWAGPTAAVAGATAPRAAAAGAATPRAAALT